MNEESEDLTYEELMMLQRGGIAAWWVFVALWLVALALSIIFTAWFLVAVVVMSVCIAGVGQSNDDVTAEIMKRQFEAQRGEERL
jgi:hypothetical protein